MQSRYRLLAVIAAVAGAATAAVLYAGDARSVPPDGREVLEQNLDANGHIRVHEQGTANVALTPGGNTVELGPADTGKLTTANGHLSKIEGAVTKLQFDGQRNLNVNVAAGTLSVMPAPATTSRRIEFAIEDGHFETREFPVVNASLITLMLAGNEEFTATFEYATPSGVALAFSVGETDGPPARTIALNQPIPINRIFVHCHNESDDCGFVVSLVGS